MGVERGRVCPICGRHAATRQTNGAAPFCSQACKLVDLGKWLDGAYRIPGPPAESDVADAGDLRVADEEDE